MCVISLDSRVFTDTRRRERPDFWTDVHVFPAYHLVVL